jgi:hypothetical protein
LVPGYSLFDVSKKDAQRVVGSLKGATFMGKRLYSELADPDKDYARASARKNREAASGYEFFDKKGRGGKKKKRN